MEKSAALREVVEDERYQRLTELTGDGHLHNARAELTDVTDRIAAADNENDPKRYRARR